MDTVKTYDPILDMGTPIERTDDQGREEPLLRTDRDAQREQAEEAHTEIARLQEMLTIRELDQEERDKIKEKISKIIDSLPEDPSWAPTGPRVSEID